MSILHALAPDPAALPVPAPAPRLGLRIEARGLTQEVADGNRVLDDVSFVVEPGELVAVVGGSGAGKTTLLEAMAGIRPAGTGTITFGGVDVASDPTALRRSMGYVPQEDIIHLELPLRSTVRYAAMLRLPSSTPPTELDGVVDDVLARLDLSDRRALRVSALSGGQRKRASIAVELLTDPHVLFLDEPTSGLDPATSAGLLVDLRRLADAGATVVLTTHAVQDLDACDRVLFLAAGGRLAFAGSVPEALAYFGVDRIEEVYVLLAGGAPDAWAARWRAHAGSTPPDPGSDPGGQLSPRPGTGTLRQFAVLTRRTADTLVRNRLTLAILLGAPAMVVGMFAVLFRPGAFAFEDPDPSSVLMIAFWVAFGGFFFGLTYGLLQISPEMPIVRRERLVGLHLGAYLVAKVAVLLPFLVLVDLLLLGVLRGLDRLPSMPAATFGSLAVTVILDALAALALGLLTSAAVTHPSQATLALPLLCFPAVLFAGAILPLEAMAPVGRAISLLMPDRWAFEAIGHDLGLRRLFAEGGSALGPPLLAQYGDAGTRSTGFYWAVLVTFITVFLGGAGLALRRRSRPPAR
jgi:ABC-type multidrug transport system ATPase subunit